MSQKFSLNTIQKVLLVTINVELIDEHIVALQKEICDLLYHSRHRGVLIDFSGIEIIDSYALRLFVDIPKVTKLLGVRTLVTGMPPEVVASIVDLGYFDHDINVIRSIDEGIAFFKSSIELN